MPALALYEPDMALNVGAAMRLAACMSVQLHVIEPCGFPWSRQKMRRAGMDYMDLAQVTRHRNWDDFSNSTAPRRLVLLSTRAAQPYVDFAFQSDDILIAGRESSGVPEFVHQQAAARILIPMAESTRSLNVVNALSMVLGEALRQTRATR
ncbi:MAG: tRNA (cytidine(34)-2'-O)-methyltransferase [Alphaproteobacteria bacterium]|nr:tRNA (cytidine(34)-2'-O)-methyltransferase [Alphaproteobacteria bacterium]